MRAAFLVSCISSKAQDTEASASKEDITGFFLHMVLDLSHSLLPKKKKSKSVESVFRSLT